MSHGTRVATLLCPAFHFPGCAASNLSERWQTLVLLGAKHLKLIQEGSIWRLVTPILLHGGVLHMFMNVRQPCHNRLSIPLERESVASQCCYLVGLVSLLSRRSPVTQHEACALVVTLEVGFPDQTPAPITPPSRFGLHPPVVQLTSQFRLGTFLEERWGTRKWLLIYWVGGLGGNLLSCAFSPDKVCLDRRCVSLGLRTIIRIDSMHIS